MELGIVGMVISWAQHTTGKCKEYRQSVLKGMRALKVKSEKLSVQNKFVGVLTHEMRNFVTKYFTV